MGEDGVTARQRSVRQWLQRNNVVVGGKVKFTEAGRVNLERAEFQKFRRSRSQELGTHRRRPLIF